MDFKDYMIYQDFQKRLDKQKENRKRNLDYLERKNQENFLLEYLAHKNGIDREQYIKVVNLLPTIDINEIKTVNNMLNRTSLEFTLENLKHLEITKKLADILNIKF